jgi:hypothetical protein
MVVMVFNQRRGFHNTSPARARRDRVLFTAVATTDLSFNFFRTCFIIGMISSGGAKTETH